MASWDSSQFFYGITFERLQVLAYLPPSQQIVLTYFADRQRNPNRRGTPLSLGRYALDCWRDLCSVEAFIHAVRALEARGFLGRRETEACDTVGRGGRRVFLTLSDESLFMRDFRPPFLRFTANHRMWMLTMLLKDKRARLRGCCLTVYWYLAMRTQHPKLNLRGVFAQEVVDSFTRLDGGAQLERPPFGTNAFKMAVRRLVASGLIKEKVQQKDGRIRYVTAPPSGDFLTWRDKAKQVWIDQERLAGYFGADGEPLPSGQRPEDRMFAYGRTPDKKKREARPDSIQAGHSEAEADEIGWLTED